MMTASAALAAVAAARGVVADAALERRRLRWARPVVRRCGYLGRAERPAEWKLAGKLISIPKPSATLVRAMRTQRPRGHPVRSPGGERASERLLHLA